MIDDEVYEPLEQYEHRFRDKFSENAKAYFERLLKESGVSEDENEILVTEVKRLESEKGCAEKLLTRWTLALCADIISAIAGIVFAIWASENKLYMCIGIAVAVITLALSFPCFKKRKKAAAQVSSLAELLEEATDRAYANTAPLNNLFHWYMLNELVEQTVPLLNFDTYCPTSRITQLQERFGLSPEYFGENESVTAVQSGVIRGNPFAFVRDLAMEWGMKTYTGSLTISWTETERDSDGKTHTVTRTQTLHASIDKPYPYYNTVTQLLYGNDAAPDLSFSRVPSQYSGKDKGFFSNMGKKHELKKLKKFAQKLDDDSDFTMMSNEEFEVLFHAKDRDHEIQFRLLFTALAQMQMVKLLNDQKVGYGDDFAFVKNKRINFITPAHLIDLPLDGNPEIFRDYDLARMRERFQKISEEYFRAIYFSFAPLLTIPLYQQTKTFEEIYKDVLGEPVSNWEHESFVNYFGDKHFAHEDSVTQNILKTKCVSRDGGVANVQVTAYGHRGENRREYVSVHGGDGRYHNVPVDWVEYLPVQKTSDINIAEPSKDFKRDVRSVMDTGKKSNAKEAVRICRRALFLKN